MTIESPGPLNVAYEGAAAPIRARATDRLVLNSIQGPNRWEAGQVISQWEVTVRCSQPAE